MPDDGEGSGRGLRDTVRAVLEDRPVRLAILFGSRAEGDNHGSSDVDVAVEFHGLESGDERYNETFFGLALALDDALPATDVDLVDLRSATPSLVDTIVDNGVVLVGSRERARRLRQERGREDERLTPGERFDAALERIDEHLA